jgi:hypothetical protein
VPALKSNLVVFSKKSSGVLPIDGFLTLNKRDLSRVSCTMAVVSTAVTDLQLWGKFGSSAVAGVDIEPISTCGVDVTGCRQY